MVVLATDLSHHGLSCRSAACRKREVRGRWVWLQGWQGPIVHRWLLGLEVDSRRWLLLLLLHALLRVHLRKADWLMWRWGLLRKLGWRRGLLRGSKLGRPLHVLWVHWHTGRRCCLVHHRRAGVVHGGSVVHALRNKQHESQHVGGQCAVTKRKLF